MAVVAAGGDPVPDADPLPRRDDRVHLVDPTFGDQPVADGRVELGHLLAGVGHDGHALTVGLRRRGGPHQPGAKFLGVAMDPDLAAGQQGIEHLAGVIAGAHGQGQVRICGVGQGAAVGAGAGEPVQPLQFPVGIGVDLADGEVEDAAAAHRSHLVAITEQCGAHLTLVGDGQQGVGGVLIQHSGLVDDQ